MKGTIALMTLVLFAAPMTLDAAVYEIDPIHSSVGFKVGHLVGFVPGSFTDFSGTVVFDEGKPGESKVTATVSVGSLDTNVGDRDKHLLGADFFKADSFPSATFVSKKVVVGDGKVAKVKGDLTMLGVTKEVILDVTYNGAGTDHMGTNRVGFSAETMIDRTEFGMTFNIPAKSGGFMLANEVTLVLEIEGIESKGK